MKCETANLELVECARTREVPGQALGTHLAACESCRERWESERALTNHFRAMRIASVPDSLEWSKAVLLREFDATRRRERQVRWMWAMSTAAILLLSVVMVRDIRVRPAGSAPSGMVTEAAAYAPREYPQEEFAPAAEAGEKGFIKVPFALDPAPGETFQVVRTQLDTAELARMGVSVDPGWTGSLQADVLIGQDGLTQAVRLSNDDFTEN